MTSCKQYYKCIFYLKIIQFEHRSTRIIYLNVLLVVNEEDFQQILLKEGIHDVQLMANLPLLQDVPIYLQDWKSLARYLKLDEPTIRQIQEDNRDDFNEQNISVFMSGYS